VSQDFPATTKVNPLFPIGAIALKLNPAGSALAYATQMGSRMTALAFDIDTAGAAYIVGATNTADLVTTAGVLKPAPTGTGGSGDNMGFILKLSPDGTTFQIATLFGLADRSVEAISIRSNGILIIADRNLVLLNTSLSQQISTTAIGMTSARMAFDSTGNIHVAGTSTGVAGGFVLRKYSAVGQQLLLDKTYPFVSATVSPRIAVTAAGRIYIFGQPTSASFPTLNASQPCMANIATPSGIAGLPTADSSGGLIGATGLPIPPDQAIMILDPSGNVLHSTFTPLVVAQAAVASASGRIYAAASETLFTAPDRTEWKGVVRFDQTLTPANTLSPSCLVHGTYFTPVRLSPGALMTFFGSSLGPTPAVSFELDKDNQVPKTVGGASVSVDGKPSALLYASDKQINFIVPWTVRTDGVAVPVCVTLSGKTSCVQAGTAAAVPGGFICFYGPDITCALNQNGSINGPGNPAAPGSSVALFMTGLGAVDGTLVDGGVASLHRVRGEVTAFTEPPPTGGCGLFVCSTVTGGQKNVPVEFAGAAPNLVLGVNQVNIRIPDDMPSGLQTFTISFKSTGATAAVTTAVKLQIR